MAPRGGGVKRKAGLGREGQENLERLEDREGVSTEDGWRAAESEDGGWRWDVDLDDDFGEANADTHWLRVRTGGKEEPSVQIGRVAVDDPRVEFEEVLAADLRDDAEDWRRPKKRPPVPETWSKADRPPWSHGPERTRVDPRRRGREGQSLPDLWVP